MKRKELSASSDTCWDRQRAKAYESEMPGTKITPKKGKREKLVAAVRRRGDKKKEMTVRDT